MSTEAMPPPTLERTTIAFRPTRSASAPHTGAKIAAMMKLTEPMMPAHSSTRES